MKLYISPLSLLVRMPAVPGLEAYHHVDVVLLVLQVLVGLGLGVSEDGDPVQGHEVAATEGGFRVQPKLVLL